MATTADAGPRVCIPDERALPDGPFTALRYHFGMLLGVDDFETEQRYQRGKMRLHNAWLHRAGIVWGLDVSADAATREIRVEPGLALDPTGRALHLDVRCCVDVGAWYDDHADELKDVADVGADTVTFPAHVVISFCSCGTRPVPAISQPCEGAVVDAAYSRTFETVSLCLVSGTYTSDPPPYPRLRVLFGLDHGARGELTADELAAIDGARDAVLASATPADTLLDAFRKLADEDTVAMKPAALADKTLALFPDLEDEGVVLANVKVTLSGSEGKWKLAEGGAVVDRTPRRCHVATQTTDELLCRALGVTAAPGPQVSAIDVDAAAKTATLTVDTAVHPDSVQPDAFSTSELKGGGWSAIKVETAALSADGKTITLTLASKPGTNLFRLIAAGTGPTPVVGADPPHVPLAGASGGPAGTADDGRDYVHMTTLNP